MPTLKTELLKRPQKILDVSRSQWLQFHGQHETDLPSLIDTVRHHSRRHATERQQLPDFPNVLVQYRQLIALNISAIMYFSEKGTLHEELYALSHSIGQLKDFYYAGVLLDHPDRQAHEDVVLHTDIELDAQVRTAASPEILTRRLDALLFELNALVDDENLLVPQMHHLRKQLRGIKYILELMYRDRKMPEPLLQVYPKLVEAVEKMGKLHDGYISALLATTENEAEFLSSYNASRITLPDKLAKKVRLVLNG